MSMQERAQKNIARLVRAIPMYDEAIDMGLSLPDRNTTLDWIISIQEATDRLIQKVSEATKRYY
jgi:hypothetical protein